MLWSLTVVCEKTFAYLPWLKVEFGWSERLAQNFISVAEKLKSAKNCGFAHLAQRHLLLATPSVPNEAREKAGEKVEAGEEMTFATARELVAEARKKKRPWRPKTLPVEKQVGRLVTVLERCRDRWNPKELAELARHLREFADSLDSQKGTKKTKKG